MTQFQKELRQWLSDNCVISFTHINYRVYISRWKDSENPIGDDRSKAEWKLGVLMEQHHGYSCMCFVSSRAVLWAVYSVPLHKAAYTVI